MRCQSLAQMALAVRQRVDLGGQQNAFGGNSGDNITDTEMASYLNASVCEVFGILVSKFGDNYYFAPDYFLPQTGAFVYPLPEDCHKLLNVDYQISPGVFRSIKPYNNHQRNANAGYVGNTQTGLGWANVTYQEQGDNIVFQPQTGPLPYPIRLQYIPEPPLLVSALPVAWAPSTVYAQGAYVFVTLTPLNGKSTSYVLMALNAGTSGAVSPASLTIGLGTSALTYTSLVEGSTIIVSQSNTSFSLTVNGSVVVSLAGSYLSASAFATAVNGNATAAAYVSATGGAGAVTTGNGTVPNWSIPGTTTDNGILWSYQCPLTLCQTYFNGVAGWEDLVILDSALKCATKQESSQTADLAAQRAGMLARIEAEAANRQAGDPMVVTPGYGSLEGDGMDDGGNGFGWGSY